jgi:hypothetical protein
MGFELLDPHVAEETRRYGKLTVLTPRMNPDLPMGDGLLKNACLRIGAASAPNWPQKINRLWL